jgi:hypothetical protein
MSAPSPMAIMVSEVSAMIQGSTQIFIDKPAADVLAFQSDPRSELVWNRDAIAVDRLDGAAPDGAAGARYRGTYRGAGTFEITVVERDANKVRSIGKARFLEWELVDVVEPQGNGTVLRRSMTSRFHGPLKLMEPFLGPVFKKRFAQSADAIRRSIDSGVAAEAARAWRGA